MLATTAQVLEENKGRGNSSSGIITFAEHFRVARSASDCLFVCFSLASTEEK